MHDPETLLESKTRDAAKNKIVLPDHALSPRTVSNCINTQRNTVMTKDDLIYVSLLLYSGYHLYYSSPADEAGLRNRPLKDDHHADISSCANMPARTKLPRLTDHYIVESYLP